MREIKKRLSETLLLHSLNEIDIFKMTIFARSSTIRLISSARFFKWKEQSTRWLVNEDFAKLLVVARIKIPVFRHMYMLVYCHELKSNSLSLSVSCHLKFAKSNKKTSIVDNGFRFNKINITIICCCKKRFSSITHCAVVRVNKSTNKSIKVNC